MGIIKAKELQDEEIAIRKSIVHNVTTSELLNKILYQPPKVKVVLSQMVKNLHPFDFLSMIIEACVHPPHDIYIDEFGRKRFEVKAIGKSFFYEFIYVNEQHGFVDPLQVDGFRRIFRIWGNGESPITPLS